MVNINGIDWRIFIVSSNHPTLQRSNGSYTIGCCDNNVKKIYIVEGLNKTYFKRVLCHELVHACMYSYKVELNEYQEEVLADIIATYGQEIIYTTNSIFCRLAECKKNKGNLCE